LSLPAYSPERHASQDSSSSISTSSIVSPSPPQSTSQTSTSNTSVPSSKPKRRQTLAACRPCRKRKSKCDGARPRCNTCIDKASPCVYSVEEGKTQQQASREGLRAYRTVVCMLRIASAPDTQVILRHLKQHDDMNEAVKTIQADMSLRSGVGYRTLATNASPKTSASSRPGSPIL
ncbi:hypothetical protein E4T44_09600, partial [Aureobasidium sp. EXF-8845]